MLAHHDELVNYGQTANNKLDSCNSCNSSSYCSTVHTTIRAHPLWVKKMRHS